MMHSRVCWPVFVCGIVLFVLSVFLLLAGNAWRWTLEQAAIPLALWCGAAYGYGMTFWAYKAGQQ